jgi:large subunit ribosomal protein L17
MRKNMMKELFRGPAERMITLAKKGNAAGEAKAVHARRQAAAKLADPEIVKRLFDEIAPRYAERPGGYTRILKLGPREGDGAEMVLLELVEE